MAEESRDELKARLEKELAELKQDGGKDAKAAEREVKQVVKDAEDDVKALENEVRKHKVERAADPDPKLEKREESNVSDDDKVKAEDLPQDNEKHSEGDRDPENVDRGESLEQETDLEHDEANHGPEHEKLPGDEGDTRVLYTKPQSDDPAKSNRNLRELSLEEQARRRGL